MTQNCHAFLVLDASRCLPQYPVKNKISSPSITLKVGKPTPSNFEAKIFVMALNSSAGSQELMSSDFINTNLALSAEPLAPNSLKTKNNLSL